MDDLGGTFEIDLVGPEAFGEGLGEIRRAFGESSRKVRRKFGKVRRKFGEKVCTGVTLLHNLVGCKKFIS